MVPKTPQTHPTLFKWQAESSTDSKYSCPKSEARELIYYKLCACGESYYDFLFLVSDFDLFLLSVVLGWTASTLILYRAVRARDLGKSTIQTPGGPEVVFAKSKLGLIWA